MWRHLYSIILVFLTPALIFHVVRKYRRERQSSAIWSRLGLGMPDVKPNQLWIHACSLGEAKVALMIANKLRLGLDIDIWFTTTTPAGMRFLLDKGQQAFVFPWDFPWVWAVWLRKLRPKAVVFIETELWPNLIAACHRQKIPTILANGRLSERSAARYSQISWLARPMWTNVSRALMQSSDDAHRVHALGVSVDVISEVGSVKLDQSDLLFDPRLIDSLCDWQGGRTLLCSMSSHSADEQAAMLWLVGNIPDFALLCVPRHPVRATEVQTRAEKLGLTVGVVSRGIPKHPTDVLIGDTFGQMASYLDVADVVIMGGSFDDHGGQNPVEPALLAKPIVAGPSTYNFTEITQALIDVGGLIQTTEAGLDEAIQQALGDGPLIGMAACKWVLANRGSTERQAAAILAILDAC
ncbi:hypothetical protein N8005_05880 [Litorivicinus sp.]|nr:hypothetical protein [Litorivicinus sp.]MDC1208851.1 hypothetical protein [Litorivicinus sp.]